MTKKLPKNLCQSKILEKKKISLESEGSVFSKLKYCLLLHPLKLFGQNIYPIVWQLVIPSNNTLTQLKLFFKNEPVFFSKEKFQMAGQTKCG